MNRIVRENYPVAQLPEDLRKEFAGQDVVTLIVDGAVPADGTASTDGPSHPDDVALAAIRSTGIQGGDFSRYKHLRRANYESSEEVVASIRSQRDAWAEQER